MPRVKIGASYSEGVAISDEKYVSVTTFRKTGEAVPTTTWVTPLPDGRYGFWTSSTSGKAKRLRNNTQVTVQPSDSRGRVRPGTEAESGTAALITSGPDYDAVKSQIIAKYGVMVPISRFFNTLGHIGRGRAPYGDLAIVITPDA